MTIPTSDAILEKVPRKIKVLSKIGFFIFTAAILGVLIWVAVTLTYTEETTESETLVVVHVLLNHGERTPDELELYKSNPYFNKSFYHPYGYGRLTKEGKLTEYQVGEYLKTRYSSFLGDGYSVNLVEPRTADSDMSKVSIQLVLAALFPPSGDLVWNETLLWQPTPYNYVEDDKELRAYESCEKFSALYNALLETEPIQTVNSNHQAVYTFLTNYTGINVTSPAEVYKLYNGMLLQQKLGLELEEWTESVYPDTMKNIVLDYYNFITNTTDLKKLSAGYLIKKILEDTGSKIEDTLSTISQKLFLYSGNDINVVSLLKTLGVSSNEIPSYGSNVAIEIHNIDDENIVKVLYSSGSNEEATLLELDSCSNSCTYTEFSTLVAQYIPSDNDC